MKCLNNRNARYRLALAAPEHSQEILKVIESGSFDGSIELIYTKRPDAYASMKKDGEGGVIVVAIDQERDQVCGVAACAVRRMYVNGAVKKVGYLSNLKVLPQYIGKMDILPKGYQFIYNQLKDQVDYFYTIILQENHYARRLLEKRRKSMPNYEYFGEYTVNIMKTRLKAKPHAGLTLEKGNEQNREELLQFIHQEQSQYQLGIVLDEQIVGTYLKIGLESFYAVRNHQGTMVGACALWDQHDYKQYIITQYNGLLKYLPKESDFLRAFGLPRLPRVNETVRFFTLSLLTVKDNDLEVFDFLLRHVSQQPDYDFFLLGLHEHHDLNQGLAGIKKIQYKSRLYFVDYEKKDGFLKGLDPYRQVHLECGLL